MEMAKVEKINKHVQSMITAKTALDAALEICRCVKEAFRNCARVSLFLVDPYLQAVVLKGQKQTNHWKQVGLEETDSGTMYAVFEEERDYCAALFREYKDGLKLHFNQKQISIPIVRDEDHLMFTLQIETDLEVGKRQEGDKTPIRRGKTKSSGFNKTAFSFKNSNTTRVSVRGWRSSDVAIARVISMLGACRLDVFTNIALKLKKIQTQKDCLLLANNFSNFKSHKQILSAVKHDIPRLLGFSKGQLYLHETFSKSLYALSMDEEEDRIAMREDPDGFEREFHFEQRQIVKFPSNMGLAGFAFANDGVVYINGFSDLIKKALFEMPVPHCFAIGRKKFPPLA